MELGLADHVWLDKLAAIAKEGDGLGDQFRPAMRAGWLAYIKNAYPEGGTAPGTSLRPLTIKDFGSSLAIDN